MHEIQPIHVVRFLHQNNFIHWCGLLVVTCYPSNLIWMIIYLFIFISFNRLMFHILNKNWTLGEHKLWALNLPKLLSLCSSKKLERITWKLSSLTKSHQSFGNLIFKPFLNWAAYEEFLILRSLILLAKFWAVK